MKHLGLFVVASILFTLAACGSDEPPSEAGSVEKGGALYDTFWKVSAAEEPTATHPLWTKRPDTTSNTRTGSATWRCKECHGWDYKGVDGGYASGSHRTGFEGVFGSDASVEAIVASLADAHGYRDAGLDDAELESLARFVREGLVDTSEWIDESGKFKGNTAHGKTLFDKGLGAHKGCIACHGPDGLKAPKGGDDYDDFVGKIANENPAEFLHKVRFGQPGTKMPAAYGAGVTMQDIIDLCAYAQTLPTEK